MNFFSDWFISFHHRIREMQIQDFDSKVRRPGLNQAPFKLSTQLHNWALSHWTPCHLHHCSPSIQPQ